MKGFNTESLVYFVLGFADKKKSDVIIGAYDKVKDVFKIDYGNILYPKVKREFIENGQKLNIVKTTGMGYEDYISMQTKGYVYNHCFLVDVISLSGEDETGKGYISLNNNSVLDCNLGLFNDFVWDTGNLFESCNVYFEYNDFLKLLDIKVLAQDANIEEEIIEL